MRKPNDFRMGRAGLTACAPAPSPYRAWFRGAGRTGQWDVRRPTGLLRPIGRVHAARAAHEHLAVQNLTGFPASCKMRLWRTTLGVVRLFRAPCPRGVWRLTLHGGVP